MKVLITGSDGFLGKNLKLLLSERSDVEVLSFSRSNQMDQLPDMLYGVDYVYHFAGVNRPHDSKAFTTDNVDFTSFLARSVCQVSEATGRQITIIGASSVQALSDTPYGRSKLAAESTLRDAAQSRNVSVFIFRLPNIFGKWCKPNYNSVVATFCYNISRDLPVQVNDPAAPLKLMYVDDVINCFVQLMDSGNSLSVPDIYLSSIPQYNTTVGELLSQIQSFKDSRSTLMIDRVGTGLVRALYATYLSYLPTESFSYVIKQYNDSRGIFAEMLKTPDCGQFSFFTVRPGITRGGHYHNSKSEKFLVLKGRALFKFRHMHSSQTHELVTTDRISEIVETVPGWTHDITNIGSDEMIVMLWANEVFDPKRSDTFACSV